MAINPGLQSYTETENDYIEGINTPHGRVTILFDTIISNLDNMMETHPKTDFVSLGKCLNGLKILANSLNMEKGGEMANNLVELYDYCRRSINNYVQEKNIDKLNEAHGILSKLADGWKAIKPKKS